MGKILKFIRNNTARFIPNKLYLSILFYHRMGYWMNWNNPRTFCEKIQWLKIYYHNDEYTKMADKYEAKKYVASIIGDEYIIPTFAVYNKAEDINFDNLPKQFVLKCTHDSGGVIICKDKSKLNKKIALKKLHKWLNRSFYWQNREWPYKDVKPRIIAEKYMKGEDYELKDYKFFCFNGKALYCQVIANRSTDETIDFYDRNWIHQPFIGLLATAHNAYKPQNRPKLYHHMLTIADKLSTEIKASFVRIDLYNINGNIYFGEITFFPSSGTGRFKPKEWDTKLGNLITLPPQKHFTEYI